MIDFTMHLFKGHLERREIPTIFKIKMTFHNYVSRCSVQENTKEIDYCQLLIVSKLFCTRHNPFYSLEHNSTASQFPDQWVLMHKVLNLKSCCFIKVCNALGAEVIYSPRVILLLLMLHLTVGSLSYSF